MNKKNKENSLNNAIEQDVTGEQREMTFEQAKAEVLKLTDSGKLQGNSEENIQRQRCEEAF